MLSWTFVVAALAVLAGSLPAAARRVALPVGSVVAVAAVWDVPVLPILAATLAVYALGRVLPRLGERARGTVLALAIVAALAALAAFKLGGRPSVTLAAGTSVLGLSYFTLKFIQHLVDAAGGRAAAIDLPAFVGAVFFLPTYPAGPIERTGDFARELAGPGPSWRERGLGLERVVFGLGKKFLLADTLLAVAEPLFRDPASASRAWLAAAVYAFAIGLYLDFAAYSDLAIGVARCLGIRVRENFDRPYLQPNLGALWQHWHMSFTGWLRDFVFIPVTRRVLRRTGRPLPSQVAGQTVTMLACGLWHGLAWNFAAWGALHGAGLSALTVWRAWRGPAVRTPLREAVATLATFHFFALALVLFACDLPRAGVFLARLLGL